MANYSRTGPASRALALDLVLRTFMNSTDFNVSNSKVWDNISRLVPGTTPLQCAQRWEELLSSNSIVAGDLSGLTATGRPISGSSSRPKKLIKRPSNPTPDHPTPASPAKSSSEIKISTGAEITRPRSVMLSRNDRSRDREDWGWRAAVSSEDKLWNTISQQVREEQGIRSQEKLLSRGAFAANFCQNLLKRSNKDDPQQSNNISSKSTETSVSSRVETKKLEEESSSSSPARTQVSATAVASSNSPNMIIHVSDDAKKMEKDFVCSRDVLVEEMHYFAEHLSSDAPQPWDEVDISVHCDIPVFEWLMRYAKRGLYSGPCGETLTEPLATPTLEVDNIVSILISSEFLRMEKLVEECLDYCSRHLSAVLASPCNMGCINDKLVTRLAAKLTPLQVEETVDRKDKLKSKLFLYHLEQLFKPVPQQSSVSAATLYRCKHCKRLLTSEQDNLLPCTTQKYNQYLATETSLYSGTPYCTPYSGTPGPVQWNPIIVVPLYSGTLYCGTPVQWNPHTVEPPYCGTPVQWNPIEWNPRPCTVEPHSMVPTRVFYVLPMYYRLSICTSGKMVYSHELCPSWSINSYIQSLQQTDGLTPRDLYWRIWSLVNMLQCEECHTPFQCCDLMQCSYHPEGTPCHSKNGKATYPCCSQPAAQFSLIPSAQNGCCFRAHSVSTNGSELSKQVYSTLLRLPDSLYTQSDPAVAATGINRDKKKGDSCLRQSIQRELEGRVSETPKVKTTLLSLLQTEHAKPRHSTAPIQESGTNSEAASTDTVAVSSSSTATTLARQQTRGDAVSVSDMEEDEEDEDGLVTPQQYAAGRSSKRRGNQRQRHYRHEGKGPGQTKDWVWNQKKSRRWNQDMQRESDERRQNQLVTQLSRMNTTASKVKEVTYAGGIFSRLEAQFRAQQAAKAIAIQTTQSRSNRKRF